MVKQNMFWPVSVIGMDRSELMFVLTIHEVEIIHHKRFINTTSYEDDKIMFLSVFMSSLDFIVEKTYGKSKFKIIGFH